MSGSFQTNRLKHQKPEERGFYEAIRERYSVKTASRFPPVFFSPPKAPTIDRIGSGCSSNLMLVFVSLTAAICLITPDGLATLEPCAEPCGI